MTERSDGPLIVARCPCCGGRSFRSDRVLWPELIEGWELDPYEVQYVDRQQGLRCVSCAASLRSMTLARAILRHLGYGGTLARFVRNPFRRIRVLEINEAGELSPYLRKLRGHTLARFPDVDAQAMPYGDGAFDLVVHSDTLEHVPDPIKALRECRRVLRPGGACVYTVPIIVGRRSRTREGLPANYHGNVDVDAGDWAVVTEYGADAWTQPLEAGFADCTVSAIEYPSSICLTAIRGDPVATFAPPPAPHAAAANG